MPSFTSNNTTPAVEASNTNSGGGDAVVGAAKNGRGIVGRSDENTGVLGTTRQGTGRGVEGYADNNYGVYGESRTFPGVRGTSSAGGRGVEGWSTTNSGIWGISTEGGNGVEGISERGVGAGVVGSGRVGVIGRSPTYRGVYGWSHDNAGVVGESDDLSGVYAISHHPQHAGLYATNDRGGPAALFGGNVVVTGFIQFTGGDLAEEFPVSEQDEAEPGMVMVLAGDDGLLRPCETMYDRRVMGVVAGGGKYAPAIVMDRDGHGCRRALALVGKTQCMVDARLTPIAAGDLLTTSQTRGHAMNAIDGSRAFGAVIGKALGPLAGGLGMIPILVTLQ
jgi:hypothetical protein